MVPGVSTGEDRRVVGERDGGETGDRAVLEPGTHVEESRDVRRFPCSRHGIEHVRVGAVEEEPDHVPRSLAVEEVGARHAVLPGEESPVGMWSAAEQGRDRRRDVDESGGTRDQTAGHHALAGDHERCACLDHTERAVLTAVAALVLPVVVGGVDHAQIGRRGVVEELSDVVERVRVRVVGAGRVALRDLGCERSELLGRLVGERVVPFGLEHVEAGVASPEPACSRGRSGLVRAVAADEHHVDDRVERGIEQHFQRPVRLLPPVDRHFVCREPDRGGA